MAIIDDDAQNQPIVDEAAIANRVVQQLQQQNRQPVSREQFDSINAAAARLKRDGYDDTFIEGQVLAMQALRMENDQKLKHVADSLLSHIQNDYVADKLQDKAQDVIRRNLAARYKANPALKDMDSSIRDMIGKKWNSNKQYTQEWNNKQLNELGLEEITDLAADHFESLLGGDRETKTAPSITGSSSATAKNQPAPTNKDELTEDDLENEHQQEFFYALTSAREQYLGESSKDAKQKALASAHKLKPPPLKKAVI